MNSISYSPKTSVLIDKYEGGIAYTLVRLKFQPRIWLWNTKTSLMYCETHAIMAILSSNVGISGTSGTCGGSYYDSVNLYVAG